MIRLYDTAKQDKVQLAQRRKGEVSIYVCGPTVYGPPHLGHGRHVLTYDVLRRFLSWSGYSVIFVSNITDIDDKIIDRASEEGRNWAEVAEEFESLWWEALDRLGVERPDEIPHATDYVDQMVDLVKEMVESGKAYSTDDGVYLSTTSVAEYGQLANQSLENLVEGGGDRTVVGTQKKHACDFALWKFTKPGEPSWPSPWGDGRPGWHTECVAMSLDILGEGFDLHTGGLDLVFPHHENEVAQAAALNKEFARGWMHHGFVEQGGEKMSKSLGNVMNLMELVDTYDPRAYRLLVLQSHYRSPMEVTTTTLKNAESALKRLDGLARRSTDNDSINSDDGYVRDDYVKTVMGEFADVMNDDLDTAGAVDLMFRQVRESNSAADRGETDQAERAGFAAKSIATVLGFDIEETQTEAPEEVQQLAEKRKQAREQKDFDAADALRDKISDLGWTVEDGADGPVLYPS